MTYVIAEPCRDVLDRACIDVCPVDCIYLGETMVFINPDECIDCSACEPACPVEAIFPASELPEQWRPYEQANAAFFEGFTGSNSGRFAEPRPDPTLPARCSSP